MPYRRNYPATVREVLDDRMTFRPAALAAVRALRREKPWRGTPAERLEKLRRCGAALAAAYGIPAPTVSAARDGDCYRPATHAIVLGPNLSVVTFLHEFGHARGMDERQTCRWSINLFRRVFPRSFARCRAEGHTLRRPDRGGRTLANLHYPPAGDARDDYRRHGYQVRTVARRAAPRRRRRPGREDDAGRGA